jgi:hypothetical protein
MEWNFARERKNTKKSTKRSTHSFEHITSHPLVMGIYLISANYSSHNSLSNGIIIFESFLTNINILVTKVGRKGKKTILGTSCGRGLRNEMEIQSKTLDALLEKAEQVI